VGTVDIKSPSNFSGEITNFLHHTVGGDNALYLENIGTVTPSLTWVQDPSYLFGTLEVFTGGGEVNIQIGGYHLGGFTDTVDTAINGLIINAVDTIPCFASGTRIATAIGEVAVEALEVGDEVLLAAGGAAPIVWIGHRRASARGHARPLDVNPIRVAAGCFGPGQPRRDLWLSPDHAVYADGVLIPVRALVDGVAIASVAVEEVVYFHIELADHAVILAEGLACESYLDTDDHNRFANRDSAPERPTFMEPCAPIVIQGEAVERVRRRIRQRMAERVG